MKREDAGDRAFTVPVLTGGRGGRRRWSRGQPAINSRQFYAARDRRAVYYEF